MKPIELDEILKWDPEKRRTTLRFLREGDSIQCTITSECFYQCFEGEKDLTGKIAAYNSNQIAIFEEDVDQDRVLHVPKMLAYAIAQELMRNGKTLDDLRNSRWKIRRDGKYTWHVELIGVAVEDEKDMILQNTVDEGLKVLKNKTKVIAYVKSLIADVKDDAILKAIASSEEKNKEKKEEKSEIDSPKKDNDDDEDSEDINEYNEVWGGAE